MTNYNSIIKKPVLVHWQKPLRNIKSCKISYEYATLCFLSYCQSRVQASKQFTNSYVMHMHFYVTYKSKCEHFVTFQCCFQCVTLWEKMLNGYLFTVHQLLSSWWPWMPKDTSSNFFCLLFDPVSYARTSSTYCLKV